MGNDEMTAIGDLSRAMAQQGIRPLVEAGAAMATIADPDRDLCDLMGAFNELASQLRYVGGDLGRAHDEASESRHARMLKQAAESDRQARAQAARAAKEALVVLVALIAELENSLGPERTLP